MGSFARALGFGLGGAMTGYGQGIVEQAKLNWQKMLQEESEQRADARALASDTRRQTFEAGQNDKNRELDKQKEERMRVEGQENIRLQNKKIEVDAAQTEEQRKATELYRKESRADRMQARQDRLDYQRQQFNQEARRLDERAEQISAADLAQIKKTEEIVAREQGIDIDDMQYAEPEQVEKFNKTVLGRLTTPKLAKFYSATAGVAMPEPAAPAPAAGGAAQPAPGAAQAAPAGDANFVQLSGDDLDASIKNAKAAIASGANPEAVRAKLKAAGINPAVLDASPSEDDTSALPPAEAADDSIPVGANKQAMGLGKSVTEAIDEAAARYATDPKGYLKDPRNTKFNPYLTVLMQQYPNDKTVRARFEAAVEKLKSGR